MGHPVYFSANIFKLLMTWARTKRYLLRTVAVLFPLWLIFVSIIAYEMHKPPEQFGRFMSHMPIATFFLAPFETMWVRARAGVLKPGASAPDFHLKTLDKTSQVSLSDFRGKSPVVLVFGSYT
jgi:hypothetical protein